MNHIKPWTVKRASLGFELTNLLVELHHQNGLRLDYWPDDKLVRLWQPVPGSPWHTNIAAQFDSGNPFSLRQAGHYNEVPSLDAVLRWIHDFWINPANHEVVH